MIEKKTKACLFAFGKCFLLNYITKKKLTGLKFKYIYN